MIAKTLNLKITQGRDVERLLTFFSDYDAGTKLDITGYTFNAQIRERLDLSSTKLADFTVSVNTTNSTITLTLSETDTADLPPGTCWWDLVVTQSGDSQSWLGGQVIVHGGATEV